MIKVPTRADVSRASPAVKSSKNNKHGMGLKQALREKSKTLPEYGIQVDNGGIDGKDDQYQPIPIDNLGKWLFGVPGYKGHLMVDVADDEIKVHISEEAPDEAFTLIRKAIDEL